MSGAPNLQKLISGYLRQVQVVEDSTTAIFQSRLIEHAVGEQIDRIGALVGCYRRGRNDADYKVAINAQRLINTSSGTVEDILAIFKALLPSHTLHIIEYTAYSAEFKAVLSGTIALSDVKYLRYVLKQAKLAGVYGLLKTDFDAATFRFAGGSGAPRGFGVGKWAGIG